MSTLKYITVSFLLTFFFISCSTTKYVPDGEYLLNKVDIKSNPKVVKRENLVDYLKQQPNYKVLGFWNVRLGMYSLSGRDTTNRINRLLKKLGSPPVILDPDLTEGTVRELQRVFYNMGYMDAIVTHDTRFKKKKAAITYNITPGIPYRIGEVKYQIQNLDMAKIILQDSVNSLVKPGILFNGNVLNNERSRIVNLLKQQGYYTFSKDNIHCFADSSAKTRLVDLTMDIRTIPVGTQITDSVKASTIRQDVYYINDVFFLVDNLAQPRSRRRDTEIRVNPPDTILYGDYHIIQNKKSPYRFGVFSNNCFIRPGARYNENDVVQTSDALRNLQAFRYSNIRFQEADSAKLNCLISVNSGKFQTVSTSIEGTNSAGDLGVAGYINYRHRNIFRGSEVLGLKLRGAYEALNGSVLGLLQNHYTEVGVETSVLFPKFQFPFINKDFKKRLRASTEYTLAFNRQARPEYERVVFSGSWRYKWALGKGRYHHSFDPLFFDYVHVPYKSDEFLADLEHYPALLNSFEDHLIAGLSHSYYTSNRGYGGSSKSLYSIRTTVESSGLSLYGFSVLFGAKKDHEDRYKFFGAPISQYMKGNIDVARSHFLNENSSFAYHFGFGIAYPYANSNILPFERRFYSGGANSVRGWSVRSLGPGTYQHTGYALDYLYQVGDIRLDMNVEWRSHIFWVLQLAAYIDAGNIWTIKDYESQPGGVFKFNEFHQQIAASYGLGLRLDFNYFLVRLDTGMKAHDPAMTEQSRWVMLNPKFSRDFAIHFAIGYPF